MEGLLVVLFWGFIYVGHRIIRTSFYWRLLFCLTMLICLLRVAGWKIHKSLRMDLADRMVGLVLSSISVFVFTYYTFWVIILPFVDSDHFVHKYFLPQEYAIFIPVSAGVMLLCLLSVFIGFVMIKSKKKKA